MDRLREVAEALTALSQGRKAYVSAMKTMEAVLYALDALGIMYSAGPSGIVYQIEIETAEKAASESR